MNTLLKLAIYNHWANERVLNLFENIESIPADCLHLFSHIMNAQVIWLNRIKNIKNPRLPFDENTLMECREIHETSAKHLVELTNLEPDELEKIKQYFTTKGDAFETSIHEILIQVFNHGTYHCGQIAKSLRQNGLEPVNTDFITFARSK